MRIVLMSAALTLGGLLGCAGNGSPDQPASEESSAHGRAPTPVDAWKNDEPATDAPPFTTDEPAEENGAEEAAGEDPGALPARDNGDGTASTAQALSTSYGTTFNLTYYWVAQRPYRDPNQVTLRDCGGNFLTYASYAWRDQVRIEMTGRFTKSDGTKVVFNDAGGCWKKMSSSYSWGMGVPSPVTGTSYKLRPFRSIAVDKSVLSIGKWYYIKQLDGVVMPSPVSGMVHDGCVRAVDIGWGIYGKHIDFFAGLQSAYSKIINGSSTMGGRSSVTVYDGAAKCQLHIERGY